MPRSREELSATVVESASDPTSTPLRSARLEAAADAESRVLEPLELPDLMEPPERTELLDPTEPLEPTLSPAPLLLLLRTTARPARMPPLDLLDPPDPRELPETPELLELLEPPETPELLDPLEDLDPPETTELLEPLEPLELPEPCRRCLAPRDPLDPLEPLDLRDLPDPPDPMDTPDPLEDLDPLETREPLEPTVFPDPMERLEPLEIPAPRVVATTALLLALPLAIRELYRVQVAAHCQPCQGLLTKHLNSNKKLSNQVPVFSIQYIWQGLLRSIAHSVDKHWYTQKVQRRKDRKSML